MPVARRAPPGWHTETDYGFFRWDACSLLSRVAKPVFDTEHMIWASAVNR